jgi:mono/diheme cytochrome c family protein
LLKLFEGPLEIFGAVVLPGLAVLALILVPFLDRGRMVALRQRTTAIGAVSLAAIAWTGLTAAAIRSTPPEAASEIGQAGPATWQQLSPEELAGIGYYRGENCSSCHKIANQGKPIGPDLTSPAIRRDAQWMIAHFKRPQELVPGSIMPPVQLSDSQLNALAAFLLKLTPANAAELTASPDFAVQGALIYQRFRCGNCHQANGVGMKLGPVLNGLSRRRTKEWIVQHFLDPHKLSPGSTMPPYRFPPRDMNNLTEYLLSLPVSLPD